MKSKAVAAAILIVALLILALNMFYVKDVKADEEYAVEWVNHRVEVLYNGYVFINDTIKISGTAPKSFLIGFPYKYGPYVLRYVAFDSVNSTRKYKITADVPLNDRVGFYGVNISLDPPPVNGIFTVGFILSNSLLVPNVENEGFFTLDFPAYPSLTVNAPSCNASVILPKNAKYVNGTVGAFNYSTNEKLPCFQYQPANVTFQLTSDEIQLFVVEEFKREVRIGGMGEIEVSDSYYIRSRSPGQITFVEVVVLPNASNLYVEDEFGRKSRDEPTLIDANTSRYRIKLALPMESGYSTSFIIRYTLPSNIFIHQNETGGVVLHLIPFQNVNYYVEKAWMTFILPEGAKITQVIYENTSVNETYDVSREIFQEKIDISKIGALFLDDFSMRIVYEYNPLWLSFRPTLWVWALTTLGCAVVAVWKRLKAPTVAVAPMVAVRLSPETIKSFIDSYEEKRRIISEINSLEVAVGKRRIPRRRYKVQRRTLETRLATLSRNLDELKLKLRSAGGRYADLMRQLEVAETEVNEVTANIRSIETRHRKGELTLEAYRRLLAEYKSRREKAETAISGILLRLREEIR
ncbi:MAG: hypothetical protein QXX79_00735 [Candidatus Bathyarchaeia archaeon]